MYTTQTSPRRQGFLVGRRPRLMCFPDGHLVRVLRELITNQGRGVSLARPVRVTGLAGDNLWPSLMFTVVSLDGRQWWPFAVWGHSGPQLLRMCELIDLPGEINTCIAGFWEGQWIDRCVALFWFLTCSSWLERYRDIDRQTHVISRRKTHKTLKDIERETDKQRSTLLYSWPRILTQRNSAPKFYQAISLGAAA